VSSVGTAAAAAAAVAAFATAGVLSDMRTNSVHEQDTARVAASMDARSGRLPACRTNHEKSREVIAGKYMNFLAVGK
jgi:hypothetical protein